jgi:hypothetical protein
VQLNTIIAGKVNVQFDIESIASIDSITIQMSMSSIEFHVIKTDISFLFSLTDMNRLCVFFDNTKNILVEKTTIMSVIRRFGHPFLL